MIKDTFIAQKFPGTASVVQLYKANKDYVVQIDVFRNGEDATLDDHMVMIPYESEADARALYNKVISEEIAWEVIQKWDDKD